MSEMSGTEVADLTEKQKEFLKECEEDFCDRFTETDEEYVEVRDRTRALPPIEDPWNVRQNRDGFRGGGRRFRDNRNQDYDRGDRRDRDRNRNWDRDRGDRDRDGWKSRHSSYSHRNQRYRPYERD